MSASPPPTPTTLSVDDMRSNQEQYRPSDKFIQLLTDYQVQLRGFIAAALGDPSCVPDVLQRTNLSLWNKSDQYDETRPFLPWAVSCARYEVLSYWRDKKRSRLVFDTDVIEMMCSAGETVVGETADRIDALRKCLDKLPTKRKNLIALRYGSDVSIGEIASRTGASVDSVKGVLKRCRRLLADCIARELKAAGR